MSTATKKTQGVSRPRRTVKPRIRFKQIAIIFFLILVGLLTMSLLVTRSLQIQGPSYITTDQEVELRPSVAGAIEKVYFHDGDLVKPKDLLIQLMADVQMAAFEEAQSDLKAKSAQYAETQSNIALRKARRKEQLYQADQELKLAQSRYKRMQEVIKSGGVSRSELEDTRLKVNVLTSRVAELNLPYDGLEVQQLNVINELINAARKRVALHQAECDARQIRANMTGYIYFNRFETGEVVKPEHVLGQIFDTSAWVVKIRVPERYLGRVKIGQKVEVETTAYWAWQHGYLQGTVTRMIPVVDSQATGDGIFYVEAQIPNPSYDLQPGMTAQTTIYADKVPLLMSLIY
ncbi:MAG: efflux RND transporter periplasmic adaptor subunit [Phycisphaeraceae bacterium]|nr:efflux RND transporter periplasmic adaptor subunit [Phycisphaeraceae bacterium]